MVGQEGFHYFSFFGIFDLVAGREENRRRQTRQRCPLPAERQETTRRLSSASRRAGAATTQSMLLFATQTATATLPSQRTKQRGGMNKQLRKTQPHNSTSVLARNNDFIQDPLYFSFDLCVGSSICRRLSSATHFDTVPNKHCCIIER